MAAWFGLDKFGTKMAGNDLVFLLKIVFSKQKTEYCIYNEEVYSVRG